MACTAEVPSWSCAATEPPLRSSVRAVRVCPAAAAMCSALRPRASQLVRPTPLSSNTSSMPGLYIRTCPGYIWGTWGCSLETRRAACLDTWGCSL